MTNAKVRILYAWESPEHDHWVESLATRLRKDGVDATIDKWETGAGDSIPHNMERMIHAFDFFVLICTPTYKTRFDDRTGGVGFEARLLTAEVLNGDLKAKLVPILRQGDKKSATPAFFLGEVLIDMRGRNAIDGPAYDQLLSTLSKKVLSKPARRLSVDSPRQNFPRFAMQLPPPLSSSQDLAQLKHLSTIPGGTSDMVIDVETALPDVEVLHRVSGADVRRHRSTLAELVSRGKSVLLVGSHGSGKSTLLRSIAIQQKSSGRVIIFRWTADEIHQAIMRLSDSDGDDSYDQSRGVEAQECSPLILVDGFDEIVDVQDRMTLIVLLQSWVNKSEAQVVVASRESGLVDPTVPPIGFCVAEVIALDSSKQQKFIDSWGKAYDLVIPSSTRSISRDDAYGLVSQHLRTTQLPATPFLLSLTCATFASNRDAIVSSWAHVEYAIGEYIDAAIRRRGFEGSSAPRIRKWLQRLAFELNCICCNQNATESELRRYADFAASDELSLTKIEVDDILNWSINDCGIIVREKGRNCGFSHRCFQQYLAAEFISGQNPDRIVHFVQSFGNSQWWQETFAAVYGLAHSVQGEAFVNAILALGKPCAEKYVDLFATRYKHHSHSNLLRRLPHYAKQDDMDVGSMIIDILRTRHIDTDDARDAIRIASQSQVAKVRVAAERYLRSRDYFRIATSPLGPEKKIVISLSAQIEIEFLYVPAGQFRMGDNSHPFKSHQPEHTVQVDDFFMSSTLVTNRAYAIYLADTGVPSPPYWNESRFNRPQQAVVGVSFCDACAFAAWISNRSGREIRLPSEAQWEFAARGPDSRMYPWGNEGTLQVHAAIGITDPGASPPDVGSFPYGAGPFGHLDLIGVAWEWCADAWDEGAYSRRSTTEATLNPLVEESDGGPESTIRPLRGAGWWVNAERAFAAYRGRAASDDRNSIYGFRLTLEAT